ncbi:hypothetical protein DH2020_024160 [Rehmannia glutinosa]|uniref:Uncharacterized protein n=1 Tax=Rehmannia glutinosa TaxID=99300 RepID=A0ABR0W8U3_REHGL
MASGGVCGVVVMLAVEMLSSRVSADPDLLQDLCVADLTSDTYRASFKIDGK